MYDNGLLKYYQSLPSEKGFLDLTSLNVTSNLSFKGGRVKRCNISDKSYFTKVAVGTGKYFSKDYSDAEILLSQIYNKAGVTSTVYLPVQLQDRKYLISDDISSDNVVQACNFFKSPIKGFRSEVIPFLAGSDLIGVNPEKFYSKSAMQQQTKMRILDAATYIYDRHSDNFFYVLGNAPVSEEPTQTEFSSNQIVDYFRNLSPSKTIETVKKDMLAEDVIAIDFGISGDIIQMLDDGSERYANLYDLYRNDFSSDLLHREELMQQVRENETLAELIDKKEFAETVGSLDPVGIAQEIKETTGYEVNSNFTSFLARSFDVMADTLIQ